MRCIFYVLYIGHTYVVHCVNKIIPHGTFKLFPLVFTTYNVYLLHDARLKVKVMFDSFKIVLYKLSLIFKPLCLRYLMQNSTLDVRS